MSSWVQHQANRISGVEKNVPWFVGDKLKAYDFAKSCGVQTPYQYAAFMRADEFDAGLAPEYFVCKPLGLHSTQGVMLLQNKGNGLFYDFLRKRELNTESIIREQLGWYDKTKYKSSYRLIFEELLIPENGSVGLVPYDYKFYCFGDVVGMISQIDRNTPPPKLAWFNGDFSDFDVDGNLISDWSIVARGEPLKPTCHSELIEAAKKISVALKTPFASVDMYATSRGPVLGEITLSPGGPYYGKMYRFQEHYDQLLGQMWDDAIARG